MYLGRVEDGGESCQGNLSFHVEVLAAGVAAPLILQPSGKNLADSSEILDYWLDKIRALCSHLSFFQIQVFL